MELFEYEKALESFMQKQERKWEQDKKYSRLMPIPVAVIVASILVLCYSYWVGPQLSRTKAIPTEPEIAEVVAAESLESAELIDINKAGVEDFKMISGIGEAKAQSIVLSRKKMGGFRTIEDVLNVDGIGEALLVNIKKRFLVQ